MKTILKNAFLNRPRLIQVIRALMYILFFCGGFVCLFYPSAVVFGAIGGFSYIWSSLLMIGSIFSAAGVIGKAWVGEFVGLNAIIACLLLYSVGCFTDTANISGPRIFLGLIFLGFTLICVTRREDVKFQKRTADYEKRVRDGKPGL